MKKILFALLFVVAASCGKKGADNNGVNNGNVGAEGGVRFVQLPMRATSMTLCQATQNQPACPGGAFTLTLNQTMSWSQVARYFRGFSQMGFDMSDLVAQEVGGNSYAYQGGQNQYQSGRTIYGNELEQMAQSRSYQTGYNQPYNQNQQYNQPYNQNQQYNQNNNGNYSDFSEWN